MNYEAIIKLISKGMTVISALYQTAEDAWPAIVALKDFVTGAQNGTITPEQFAAMETLLDQLISDFNIPLE